MNESVGKQNETEAKQWTWTWMRTHKRSCFFLRYKYKQAYSTAIIIITHMPHTSDRECTPFGISTLSLGNGTWIVHVQTKKAKRKTKTTRKRHEALRCVYLIQTIPTHHRAHCTDIACHSVTLTHTHTDTGTGTKREMNVGELKTRSHRTRTQWTWLHTNTKTTHK